MIVVGTTNYDYLWPNPLTAHCLDQNGALSLINIANNHAAGATATRANEGALYDAGLLCHMSGSDLPLDMLHLYELQQQWWELVSESFATHEDGTRASGAGKMDIKVSVAGFA